jgi:hypothetical protein
MPKLLCLAPIFLEIRAEEGRHMEALEKYNNDNDNGNDKLHYATTYRAQRIWMEYDDTRDTYLERSPQSIEFKLVD